ncbi:MAG: hypothetical protein LBV19_08920 [Streptococcaceae bacterium]|jgi:hypothetical protein|nr:hypothetical protein [Streptococcaceae bacterium]
MTQKAKHDSGKKKKKRLLWLLSVLLLLATGIGIWLALTQHHEAKIVSGLPDVKATQKMTEGELKKYADKVVDQNNVTIQVYPKIAVESDGITGRMWVQNPPVNATGQEALLKEKNGELLFASGLIKPGYQVSNIKMTKKLSKGKHPGVIALNFYDLDSKKLVGQTKVDVSITVD